MDAMLHKAEFGVLLCKHIPDGKKEIVFANIELEPVLCGKNKSKLEVLWFIVK